MAVLEGALLFPVPGAVEWGDRVIPLIPFVAFCSSGNPDLTPTNTPLLQVVFSHLEPLTNSSINIIRKTALEARLVITTRQASGAAQNYGSPQRRSDHEIYQEALKLVQDPILPVRAHGLLMLRQLIVPPRPTAAVINSTSGKPVPVSSLRTPSAPTDHDVDPALIPAILDVFMQSVQDDDSFVFLNAVQGLSAMVDRLGRSILIRLMDVYAGGEGFNIHSSMSKTALDKRLRVGEALGQVVRRCGDALPAYGALCPLISHDRCVNCFSSHVPSSAAFIVSCLSSLR